MGTARVWSAGVVLSLVTAGAVLLTDLLTHSINLSILYSIPIYVLALHLRARWVVWVALGLVASAYVGLFMGPRPPDLPTVEALLDNYRFVNRTFSAVAILATGAIAGWQRRWAERMLQRVADDESLQDHPIYLDLVDQVRFLATLLMALAITASLVSVDWTTTAEFNLPILYAVPMVLCVLSGSLRTIWLMVPLLICLTWAGFWVSDEKMQVSAIPPLINRTIATTMLLALAVVGTYRARRGRR